MDAINCPLCVAKFSNDLLIKRLKIRHCGECFNLVCKYKDCSRKYTNISGFMKHVITHTNPLNHNVNQENNITQDFQKPKCSNNLEVASTSSNTISCDITKTFEKEVNTRLESNSKVKETISNLKIRETIDVEFCDEVSKAVDILVADLYADKFLIRTAVLPLMNKFKNFYDEYFVKILRNLNVTSPNVEMTKVLNIMANIYQNNKNEQMSIKQFKSFFMLSHKPYISPP